ncbi:MAG TPA: DinB family protein [Gemmatimonadaceae bacterium]|jgi:uncharacterized damage-inducible protein DinB|nr:DinB family protein [Gemmatimonadaceae bacterium]
MMRDFLLELIAHMRWADALVATALIDGAASSGAAPPPEAMRLFAHVAAAEHLWYARLCARPSEHAVWPSLTPEQSRDLAAENATLYERLVADHDDSELSRVVSYTNTAGRRFHNSVRDIVAHVSEHGSYHRGQIALRIRAGGGEPPYTDFIQFTRRGQ